MRTAYSPKSHIELASENAGKAYGHVPGHQYHDVDVVVSKAKAGAYRVHVCESWGSAQGYDEEHGRREVVGRGESIRSAVQNARERSKDAGIVSEYLEQALTKAEDGAIEKDAEEIEPVLDYFTSSAAFAANVGTSTPRTTPPSDVSAGIRTDAPRKAATATGE